MRPTVFARRTGSGRGSPIVAKHDQTRTRAGSRPACSAACFTALTQRAVVSSVKKVWSTTASITRPPRASEFGPNAVNVSGISPVESGPSESSPNLPHGPSWPITVSPLQSRRISRAKSSSCAVVIIGSPNALNMGAMPRPRPSEKRPPVSACIVIEYAALTRGWRVLWLVAAVAIPISRETAPTAPESVATSSMLRRSEMKHAPRPSASACCTSAISSRGDFGCPASV